MRNSVTASKRGACVSTAKAFKMRNYNNDTDPQYVFKFDAMDCIYEVDDYTNGVANPTILSYNESTGIQGNTGFIVEKSPITGYYNRKGYNYEYNHNDIKGNSDIREDQIYAISNNNTNTNTILCGLIN